MLRQALVDAETAGQQQQQQQGGEDNGEEEGIKTEQLRPSQQRESSSSRLYNVEPTNERTSLAASSPQLFKDGTWNTTTVASTGSMYEYGATTTQSITSEGGYTEVQSSVQSGSYLEDEEDYDDEEDEDDEDDDEEEGVVFSVPERIWNGLKTFVRVVANVENLWDSPPQRISSASYSYYTQQESIRNRRRNQYIVLFWFVVLASSYAGERSTFKLLVDRAGPFRLFSVQVITFSHILLFGCGLLISYYTKLHHHRHPNRSTDGPIFMPLGIPLVDCILMAVLDTITLVLVFLTGAHVPPTLTVILVQFTIPLTAFLTQIIHPDGKLKCCRTMHNSNVNTNNNSNNTNDPTSTDHNSDNEQSPILMNGRGYDKDHHNNLLHTFDNNQQQDNHRNVPAPPTPIIVNDERLPGWGGLAAAHVWGSLILFLAVSLALFPAFYSIANPDFFIYADSIPTRTAINTIFFVLSCFPAAASQLYKEHIFLQYRQPVNMGYLNLILSIFQFILVSVISPVVYGFQGLGFRGDWLKLYPPSGTSDNFVDGLKCFFGLLDEDDQENKYPEDAECRLTLLLALLYVFSVIAVGVSVDKIVNAGATKVMYRGISAGIIVAVLCMHYYDMHITDFSYGPAIDALNLVCLLLLVVGAEVYHRSSLQESTFETVYPVVMMPTFED